MIIRYLWIRIISAEPETVLTKLILHNIELEKIKYSDALTVEFRIQYAQFSEVKRIVERSGASCKVIKKEGLLWMLRGIAKRPVLITGSVVFLLLSFLLSHRVLFVKVIGNENIPSRMIIQKAERCGVRFGEKSSSVRSEDVKNQLLKQLPQLQWIGITTRGCVATIQVKERSRSTAVKTADNTISSIIAKTDGVITEMTVLRGEPLVFPGQSVREGDILVSGYRDCGIKVTAESADGEVFAHTTHQISFATVPPAVKRGEFIHEHICYSIRIGKKVINLCNHSGIPDTTCVKMYSEDYWTLPGGFQLPVVLIKNSLSVFDVFTDSSEAQIMYGWLPEHAQAYLQSKLIAGEILDKQEEWNISEDVCEFIGTYACHEMIGQVKYEEIMENNAEDN